MLTYGGRGGQETPLVAKVPVELDQGNEKLRGKSQGQFLRRTGPRGSSMSCAQGD